MTELAVAVAAPLSPDLAELLVTLEPRITLHYEPSLLAAMRHPGDFSGDPAFRRTPAQQAQFEQLLESADALYGIPDLDPTALARTAQANPTLRWVHTMAAGGGGQVKNANLTTAQLQAIVFTSSAGVHGQPLAEFALLGVLAGAKNLPRLRTQQSNRTWSGRWTMGQIAEQTILLVGLGGIGRQVAALLAPFGAHVIGTSRRDVHIPGVDELIHPKQLSAVAHRVDTVITTLPGTDLTMGLINADFFDALRPGATIVNVGRGTVIDEPALIQALTSGQVGFAALDVFAVEPLPPTSPLWSMPNVLISPHTAALSVHEDRRIAELFATNATRLLEGQPLRNVIDTLEFY